MPGEGEIGCRRVMIGLDCCLEEGPGRGKPVVVKGGHLRFPAAA